MALPMNVTPVYTLTIPSTGQTVKYRPFLVKEEKALLIAQQSEDLQVMLDCVREVIKACVKDKIDADNLATFDIEYIFTQLRAVSVGEVVDLVFKCDTCTSDDAKTPARINLLQMKVNIPENHEKKINLFGNVGIMMKYPTIDTLKKIETADSDDIEQQFSLIMDCIEYIYDDEEIYRPHEQTIEEMTEFLNSLTSDQYDRVQNFFRTMPALRYEVSYKCPVCDKEHHKFLEGLSSFF